MDRSILEKYKNQDEKLILSKIIDKISFCVSKNKIVNTSFFDLAEQDLVKKFLKLQKQENFIFYGGIENTERNIVLFYPEKLEDIIKNKQFDFNTIFSCIRIKLPSDLYGKYDHRRYLGALMKLGINREKIGDIIVYNEGADIIILPEIEKFLITNLNELTRFSKAKIEKIKLEDINKIELEKKEMKITVSSMRIDNIVSELYKCSRNKALELINEERVLVNFKIISKCSKEIGLNDLITIRGKGRFFIEDILGNSKKGKIIVKISYN